MRLTKYSTERFSISRRAAKEALSLGQITVNGSIVKKDIDVENSDKVEYLAERSVIDFDIKEYLLEDFGDIKFLYKKPFMHSDRLRVTDPLTLSDVIATLPDFRSLSRLDHEADGVVGVVKDTLKITNLKKTYLAVVTGDFPDETNQSWSIDANNRQKVKVNDDYNGHLTYMKLLEKNKEFSLIKIELSIAARHQIRSFCEKLNCSIVGDKLYGGKKYDRLMLHCDNYMINNKFSTSKQYLDSFLACFRDL